MDGLSPSSRERTALLAHETCHHYHLILAKGMLLDDIVHNIVIGKLVTPYVQTARDVSTTKIIVSDIQDAGLGSLRPARTDAVDRCAESSLCSTSAKAFTKSRFV